MFGLRVTGPGSSASVSLDSAGRPRLIRADGLRLSVSGLESVRDETAAYPLETGPRTVFVVTASDRRYRLVHRLRDRRWTVEALGPSGSRFADAA